VDFCLNLGVQTNLSSESPFEWVWFTLDARLGIAVSQSLKLSPEVMFAIHSSFSSYETFLYPGVMLNYKLEDFFIGAGAVLPLVFYDGDVDVYPPAPKVNFGYSAKNLILTAYIFIWTWEEFSFLEYNHIGATIGYRF
jgi:hypothetical protein